MAARRSRTSLAELPPRARPISKPEAQVSAALLGRLDALLLMLPSAGTRDVIERLPFAEVIARVHGRSTRQAGDTYTLNLPNEQATLLVVGLVRDGAATFTRLTLAGKMLKHLQRGEHPRIGLSAQGLGAADSAGGVEALLAAAQAWDFSLPAYKSGKAPAPKTATLVPICKHPLDRSRITATSDATNLVRWLTTMPPDRLDPAGYRSIIQALCEREGLEYEFMDEAALRRAGAGAFLAVTQGSANRDAGIARIRYRGRKSRAAPVALVGKGLCFDTGGTNLKSHKGMVDMHTDMAGSALALATLMALARLKHTRPVEAWLALAENRIGSKAYKPQDVVTAVNGTTIQVIHTDAEGRMVLADTLALASQSRPAAIVDFATLTGACVVALGTRYSGAFTNRPSWRVAIEKAGQDSGERVWVLPMDEDYDEELHSKVADVVQCLADGQADHIYATRFLSRFVGAGIPWTHVDLSAATRHGGLAHVGSDITGFGARFMLSLLLDQQPPLGPEQP